MGFGERLIELRKSKSYTRESLAEKLGISKYTLRNYELSVNEPGSSFLKQVSDFFDVSIDYLMGMTDEKEKIRPYNLKASEYAQIEKYRILDDHGKDMVDTVLTKEHERCKAIIEAKEKAKIVELAQPVLSAAHTRTDIAESEKTAELQQQEEDIMDDPNF